MILYPNAKINLGLAVVRKRPDGYHDLETVFLPVRGLCDRLELTPIAGNQPYTFEQTGITVDCPPEDNLIVRTYLRMRERYPAIGNVAIRFEKNIPFGAGLGGGSADAAFMAKGLNELFSLGLTAEQLEEEVSPLGADCAFFIQNRPRFATGIGNIFSEVEPSVIEAIEGKWLLLIKPSCAVSTGQAYRGIITREVRGLATTSMFSSGKTNLSDLVNDFEQTVFPLFPEIADVKQRLQDLGAVYAAMSGSGATVFGLFDEEISHPDAYFPDCFIHQEKIKL